MTTVVVLLDGSRRGERALRAAATLAGPLGARIELVRAVADAPEELLEADRYLTRLTSTLPASVAVGSTVFMGDPIPVGLERADELDAAILALPAHGRWGHRHVMDGDPLTTALQRADVPLLIVPDGPADPRERLRHLFVLLDGSSTAERILPSAVELACASRASLHLVWTMHLVWTIQPELYDPSFMYGAEPLIGIPDPEGDFSTWHAADLHPYLRRLADQARRAGVPTDGAVLVGQVAPRIRAALHGTPGGLILSAIPGWGRLHRWLYGSVTDDVVRHGSVPALVLPPNAPVHRVESALAVGR